MTSAGGVTLRLQADVRAKMNELFARFVSQRGLISGRIFEPMEDSSNFNPLEGARRARSRREQASTREAGTHQQVMRKNSPPPRGPSPSSPAASPKNSPLLGRKSANTAISNSQESCAPEPGAGLGAASALQSSKIAQTSPLAQPLNPRAEVISASKVRPDIPKFYFPNGQPSKDGQSSVRLSSIHGAFECMGAATKLTKAQFTAVCKVRTSCHI